MKSKNWIGQVIGPNVRYFLIVLVISVGAAYYFTDGMLFKNLKTFSLGTLWSMCIWYSQSLGNGWIIDRLDERLSWLEAPVKRFFIGFLALVVYSFLAFQIVQLTFGYLVFGWMEKGFFSSPEFWTQFWWNGRLAVIISLVIASVLTAVGFLKRWREQAVRAEQLQKEAYIRQYNALKDQLNPHFLFNSLNVLTELVYENQDQAVSYIRKLSDVYRYVLDAGTQEIIELERELSFIQTYTGLLKERFGENLQVAIPASSTQNQYVLPLTLQLLIENAVKHNVVSRDQPLTIEILLSESTIVVRNNLQKKRSAADSTGLGLKYLRDQYPRLSAREIKVIETANTFEVEIPLIRIQET